MVDCVKAVAAAVDSATTGMTHRLIKTSMFSISVQKTNMGFYVFIDYMSSVEGNMEVHFLVFIYDFVTVCQDRKVVIIVINFSKWGKTYRC